MPPIVRASWLRGVSALPNSFAHESYIDELAAEAGVDPVEYRLRYLKDQRAVELVRAMADRAGWTPRPRRWKAADGDVVTWPRLCLRALRPQQLSGLRRGMVGVGCRRRRQQRTGEVSVTRVVAGQDSGLMINPAGVKHQIHGNVIQSTSRALKEQVSFDRHAVTASEWGTYPIITFPDVPVIDVS